MPRQPTPWRMIQPLLTPPVVERFWTKVLIGTTEGCWPFQGPVNQYGYGQFYVNPTRRTVLASRLAYFLANATIQDTRFVCHTCDNRRCCNPAHLWLGTHRENLRDMWAKGRAVVWNKGLKTGPRRRAA